jgi:hypothetical protein
MDNRMEEERKREAHEEAKSYFNLASSYTRERPILIVMCGLIGTGKTEIAKRLSRWLFMEVVSSDHIRKHLASIPPHEHRFEDFSKGIYSQEFTKKTYNTLFDIARERLLAGRSVLLDASFRRRRDRQMAQELAKKRGADFLLIECQCRDDEVKRRLSNRMREEGVVSDGRLQIYDAIKKEFEEISEIPEKNHIVLHTDRPVDEVITALKKEIPL